VSRHGHGEVDVVSGVVFGFVDSLGDQGVEASICEPDFGPIFAQTVETIVTTCQSFDPPGR
jgi:hypothetical protein